MVSDLGRDVVAMNIFAQSISGATSKERKDAKNKNPKHEIRNNFKMMKDKTQSMLQTRRIGIGVLDFPGLRIVSGLVCFEFRYSDFGFWFVGIFRDHGI